MSKRKRSWYSLRVVRNVAELTIYGEIGVFGVNAKDFRDEILSMGPVSKVRVHINSPGGDPNEGFAVYNILRGIDQPVEIVIDGLAASAASLIAMAGDTVIMPENTLMMIHLPSGGIDGEADELRQWADVLDDIRDSMAEAYSKKSGIPIAQIIEMMEDETWLTAAEAVELGFADEVVESVRIAAKFDMSKFKHAPTFGASRGSAAHSEEVSMTTKTKAANETAETAEEMEARITAEVKATLKAEADAEAAAKAEADAAAAAAAAADEGKETPTQVEARVRATLQAEAKEIAAVCELAGHADKAAGYLAEGKSLAQVTAALTALRAEEGEGTRPARKAGEVVLTSRQKKGSDESNGIDTEEVYARWNGVAKAKGNKRAA